MASLGISVIAVLHQPRFEILRACDQIMLLSDGQLRYCGSPSLDQLKLYLERLKGDYWVGSNVADLLVDHIDEFSWKYKESETLPIEVTSIEARGIPLFGTQLFLLTKRALLQLTRDIQTVVTLYGLTLLSALLIGSLYRGSEFIGPPSSDDIAKCPLSFQFLCAQNQKDTYMVQGLLINLAMGLTAGAASLSTFGGTEKLVFHREKITGQSNFAYALAKIISTLPNQLLAPLLFMSIFQWLTAPNVSFWKICVVALGICDATMNFAHLMSVVLEDNRALIVTVVGICIFNILSGFNPTLLQLHNSLGFAGEGLASISYGRWTLEAFYLSIIQVYKKIYDLKIGLKIWDYTLDNFALALTMPFVIGIVLRFLIVGGIYWKVRAKK